MARSMKQWGWRRVLFCVAILSGSLAGPLFGDTGRLTVIAACVVFLIWQLWKRTRSQSAFREAVADLFPPRELRTLLGILSMLALLSLVLLMPAAYYYGVTGFPWHLIASGIVVVAGLLLGLRARRSAQASAGSPHGEPSPSNGEGGTG